MRLLGPTRRMWRVASAIGLTACAVLAALLLVVLGDVALAAPGLVPHKSPSQQTPDGSIRVATKAIEPFVILDGSRPIGFSVDMWNEIARRTGFAYEWVIVDSVTDQLDAVMDGDADAAIAAISMTPAREEVVDFSYAYYMSGLTIMTVARPQGTVRRLGGLLVSPRLLAAYSTMLVLLLVVGHLVWLVERKKNDDFPKAYLPGVWEGLWWSAVTVTTVGYGDRTVKGVSGRILGLLWMFFGLFLIANVTAVLTTELTASRAATQILSAGDLRNHRVTAVAGTTGAQYLTAIGVKYRSVTTVDEAVDRLQRNETDAVVYDAPVLSHLAATEDDPRLRLVGGLLTRENYAIALPDGSPLEEPVNTAILGLYRDGTYAELVERWSLEVE